MKFLELIGLAAIIRCASAMDDEFFDSGRLSTPTAFLADQDGVIQQKLKLFPEVPPTTVQGRGIKRRTPVAASYRTWTDVSKPYGRPQPVISNGGRTVSYSNASKPYRDVGCSAGPNILTDATDCWTMKWQSDPSQMNVNATRDANNMHSGIPELITSFLPFERQCRVTVTRLTNWAGDEMRFEESWDYKSNGEICRHYADDYYNEYPHKKHSDPSDSFRSGDIITVEIKDRMLTFKRNDASVGPQIQLGSGEINVGVLFSNASVTLLNDPPASDSSDQ